MPNIERLTTLLEYVEKLPLEAIEMKRFRNDCGTTACLMGHAVMAFPGRFEWSNEDRLGVPTEKGVSGQGPVGRSFFELTDVEWTVIFHHSIPNDQAVQNLREHIDRWSNAQH